MKSSTDSGKVREPEMQYVSLFSLYTQLVMDELAELQGIRIGGRNISNIRYADDMVIIANSKEKLQSPVNRLYDECREKGLRINKSKMEVMEVTKRNETLPVTVNIEGTSIQRVTNFKYSNGRCDSEIRARIGMAKASFL